MRSDPRYPAELARGRELFAGHSDREHTARCFADIATCLPKRRPSEPDDTACIAPRSCIATPCLERRVGRVAGGVR